MTSKPVEPAWVVAQLRVGGSVDIRRNLIPGDIRQWQQAVTRAAADAGLSVMFLETERGFTIVDSEH